MIIFSNFLSYFNGMLKNPVIAFLKLIRVENLFIIAITQVCMKYFVFSPLNDFLNLTPSLFAVLVTSTILIAAAGYIINDYFDVKTDKINRPDTVVIDVMIKRRWAMVLHIVLNLLGLGLGLYLAIKCHCIQLVTFQMSSILLLWFYSTHFKKQLIVGNIVVSLLSATIPVMPMVYDYFLTPEISPLQMMLFGNFINLLIIIVLGYSGFAFLTSYAREVIKDMEDYKGDVQTGGKTMPIVWGMITSKVVVFFVLLITIGMLLLACIKFYKEQLHIPIYYIIMLVIIPLIVLIILIIKANNSRDFKMASLLLKGIMLTGILFTLIIKFLYD